MRIPSSVNKRAITIHNAAQPITPQSAKRCTVTKEYDVQRNNNDKDSRKQDVQSDEEVEEQERDGADQRHGYGGRVKGGANTLLTLTMEY